MGIEENPKWQKTCSLAKLEWEVTGVLHENKCHGPFNGPGSGHYETCRTLFDAIKQLTDVCSFDTNHYFIALHLAYFGETPTKDACLWQISLLPMKKTMTRALNWIADVHQLFYLFREKISVGLIPQILVAKESYEIFLKTLQEEEVENAHHFCPDIKVKWFLSHKQLPKIQVSLKERINRAIHTWERHTIDHIALSVLVSEGGFLQENFLSQEKKMV